MDVVRDELCRMDVTSGDRLDITIKRPTATTNVDGAAKHGGSSASERDKKKTKSTGTGMRSTQTR